MLYSVRIVAVFIVMVATVLGQNQYMLCRPVDNEELPVPPKQINKQHPFIETLTRSVRMMQDQPSSSTTKVKIQDLQDRIVELEKINIALVKCLATPYYYVTSPRRLSWRDAKVYCQDNGGTLAAEGIKNLVNRQKVADKFLPGKTSFWVGASDIEVEGRWRWMDGNPVWDHEIHWEERIERNTSYQDCAMIYSRSAWKAIDNNCEHLLYALCEISNCL